MSETKFTPGPWFVEPEQDCDTGYFWISAEQPNPVDHEWAIRKKADAHLIAAAPELFAALQGFITYHSGHVNTCPELAVRMEAGRAALAKARGES